jgi:hypothetical protein
MPMPATPLLVCCERQLPWRWEEDIWAAFCPRCARAFALCDPVPAAFVQAVTP